MGGGLGRRGIVLPAQSFNHFQSHQIVIELYQDRGRGFCQRLWVGTCPCLVYLAHMGF